MVVFPSVTGNVNTFRYFLGTFQAKRVYNSLIFHFKFRVLLVSLSDGTALLPLYQPTLVCAVEVKKRSSALQYPEAWKEYCKC